jgi:hypothetical protein
MDKPERQDFWKMFLFALGVQVLAVFFLYSFALQQVQIPSYEPFGNTTATDASLNAVSLVLPTVVMTVILITLLKFFGLRAFTYLISFLPIVVIVLLNPVFISVTLANYLPDIADIAALAATAVLAAAAVYATIKSVDWISRVATFLISAEVGAFFALSLQPPTLFFVPLAFAIYDIYAVFAGPLKVLINQLVKSRFPKGSPNATSRGKVRKSLQLGVLVANVGGFTLGTGDLVFYSLLAAAAFGIAGLWGAVATMAAMNAGVALTFIILTKYKRVLPGLPIPIFLGVAVLAMITYFPFL